MWLTIYIGAIPTSGQTAPPPPTVAGTGPRRRTGDERLAALESLFEKGQVEAITVPLQHEREPDVHTALANVDADDEQVAFILHWIRGI